ncbi:MAG: PepSY domain-containing protein, partial [Verrucomicrobia bacterium]|nr:PepSY domain-containing protein [Cytophagales bacterium]
KAKVFSGYQLETPKFPIEKAVAMAWQAYPNPTHTFVQLPQDSIAPIRLVLRYPYQLVRKQNTLHFDQYSGKLLKTDLYKDFNTADKIRVSNYDLHTGQMFGIFGKTIWFMAALFAASLPITGFLIWWNKRKKVKKQETSSVNISTLAENKI